MSGILTLLPLAFNLGDFNNISEQIIDDNVSLGAEAFTNIGVGIGSVFLLVFVISSVTAIMDGGR